MANLIAVTHQQARLDYFREQLAAAERRRIGIEARVEKHHG